VHAVSDPGVPHDDGADELPDLDQAPLSDTEKLLRRLHDVIQAARPVPLSTSAMINRDEVLTLIEQVFNTFPRELRQSRWLLKEREDFLAQARVEGEEILGQARARAERLVQRSELVRAAEKRARQTVETAEAEARRMRLEAEDYCDQKLGSFEIVLERTMRMVAAGRQKLQLRSARYEEGEANGEERLSPVADGNGGLFDQDRS
jgi:cell division septum initiation protein DivIVA